MSRINTNGVCGFLATETAERFAEVLSQFYNRNEQSRDKKEVQADISNYISITNYHNNRKGVLVPHTVHGVLSGDVLMSTSTDEGDKDIHVLVKDCLLKSRTGTNGRDKNTHEFAIPSYTKLVEVKSSEEFAPVANTTYIHTGILAHSYIHSPVHKQNSNN